LRRSGKKRDGRPYYRTSDFKEKEEGRKKEHGISVTQGKGSELSGNCLVVMREISPLWGEFVYKILVFFSGHGRTGNGV